MFLDLLARSVKPPATGIAVPPLRPDHHVRTAALGQPAGQEFLRPAVRTGRIDVPDPGRVSSIQHREGPGPHAGNAAVGQVLLTAAGDVRRAARPAAYPHVMMLGAWQRLTWAYRPPAAIGPRYAAAGYQAVCAAWPTIALTPPSSWCSAVTFDRSAHLPGEAPGQTPGHVLGARRTNRSACFMPTTARISRPRMA